MSSISQHERSLTILIEREDKQREISLRTAGKVMAVMDRLIQISAIDSIQSDDHILSSQARSHIYRAFLDPSRGLLTAGQVEIHSWEQFASLPDVMLWLNLNGQSIIDGALATVLATAIINSPRFLIGSINRLRQLFGNGDDVPVDPTLITPLLNLATIADKARVRVSLRNSGIEGLIDHELHDILDRISKRSTSEPLTPPLEGVVYGSDMEERRIDVYFPTFDKRLPCYYKPHMQSHFRQFTEDGTFVKISGDLWKVGRQSNPWKIDIHDMQKP